MTYFIAGNFHDDKNWGVLKVKKYRREKDIFWLRGKLNK